MSSIVHRPSNAWTTSRLGLPQYRCRRVEHSEQPLHNRFLIRGMDMVSGESRFAVRRHRRLVVVLAVSIALALSALGIESASASTRSRLALSLNSDRSSAARLDGSTVNGKIYVFVRNSKNLDKVAFYIDSPQWRKATPVRTDKEGAF